MLYIRENIPSKIPSFLLTTDKEPIESLYVELNLRNEMYLINCSYNPHKIMIKNHLPTLRNVLDLHSSKYEKMLILGDFNVGIDERHINSFCQRYNLTNLIKQPTFCKSSDKPTCIDLILTNVPRSFQGTCVIETGLSDFHLMTLTIIRKAFRKQRPRIINYRSFNHFSNEGFRKSVIDSLSNQIYSNSDNGFNRFCK